MIQDSLLADWPGTLVGTVTTTAGLQSATGPPVVLQSTTQQVTTVATQLLGLALFAGTLAALVSLLYRWASREEIPVALALLVGLSGVALYLNTTTVLGQVIAGEATQSADVTRALFNISAFLAGGVGSTVGRRVGDRFSRDVFLGTETNDVDDEVNRLVRTVGRVLVVTLPEDIDDVVGYDPVAQETKEKLAGKRFLFPRTLTVGQLRDRLVSRLKTDYGVGTVDLELADDGTVEYLAIGSRAAGIGPTLPPATNAVAIRADPAFAASAGDVVQVWETDPMRRVLTAELRGVADDVVTIAIDAADTPKLDPRQQYRLVTLPVEDRPEREFAELLRAADETFSTVTVEAGSPLHGMPVGALDLTIISVKPEDEGEPPVALPDDDQILSPGDVVFALGRPEGLRRLEIAGKPLDPSLVRDVGQPPVDQGQTPGAASQEPTAQQEPTPQDSPAVGEPILDDGTESPETAQPAGAADSSGTAEPTADASSDDIAATADAGPEPETAAADETPESETGTANAGGSTFDELKSEFESGDADWSEDDDGGDEPVESVAGGSGTSDTVPDDAEKSSESSFDELKEEFESGEADWDEDEPEESTASTGDAGGDSTDDLVDLEDADISFDEDEPDETDPLEDDADDSDDEALEEIAFEDSGDEAFQFEDEDDDEFELDDGGSSFDLEDDGDDLLDLDVDDDEDDELSFDEDDEDDEEEDEDADDNDEDDDDDDSGGGSTFAQLKEEFESGDADWEDDISDSPGGDMRLDE